MDRRDPRDLPSAKQVAAVLGPVLGGVVGLVAAAAPILEDRPDLLTIDATTAAWGMAILFLAFLAWLWASACAGDLQL